MSSPIKIHGSIKFSGSDPEFVNLELEQLTEDPFTIHSGRIWINDTEARVKYGEGPQGADASVIRHLAHDGDLAQIVLALNDKANKNDLDFSDKIKRINITNGDMVLGEPVYGINSSAIELAAADNVLKKTVLGLVSDEVILSQNGLGNIKTNGVITGTLSQWEFVTQMVGGLIPNTTYFLSIVSGKITPYPPTEAGQHICQIGKALTQFDFLVRIERPIAI